jgi:hypothetical protein
MPVSRMMARCIDAILHDAGRHDCNIVKPNEPPHPP